MLFANHYLLSQNVKFVSCDDGINLEPTRIFKNVQTETFIIKEWIFNIFVFKWNENFLKHIFLKYTGRMRNTLLLAQ